MAVQLVSFRATLQDASLAPTHERMVTGMRQLAEAIDGFVEWRDAYDGLTYWGYVVFATPEAALAWKGHPTHGAIHRQGEDSVYSEFGTQVFELVREASWKRDEVGSQEGEPPGEHDRRESAGNSADMRGAERSGATDPLSFQANG